MVAGGRRTAAHLRNLGSYAHAASRRDRRWLPEGAAQRRTSGTQRTRAIAPAGSADRYAPPSGAAFDFANRLPVVFATLKPPATFWGRFAAAIDAHRIPQGLQMVAGGRRAAAHLRYTTYARNRSRRERRSICAPRRGRRSISRIGYRWYSLRSNHRLPSGAASRPRSMRTKSRRDCRW